MQQIAEAAGRANGKEIEVDEAKKMPGGFTSATIYVEYPGGVKGEIQIIGKGAMAVAEVEHIPYDVGLGKPLVRNIDPRLEPELRGVVAPIETAIREVNADPARKAAYDQYLCDMYRHVRALEMGQESTPPTVPAGIDPALSYESLVKVQDAVAAIKAKSKGGSSTPEVAKPETADALDVKKTDGGSLTGGGEGESKPAAIRTPVTPSEAEDAKQLEKSTNRLATTFGDRLEGADTKLVGPPTDRPVIQQSASDALIGLPTDVIPPGMSAEQAIKKLQSDGMPRWGALTANERA
ncbi:MAG TPA: hypothetical protein VGO00_08805, partial [Kofleriaceae bacterium]|nr:hypothetical protein [Kofleriaceae bacterium]